MNVLFDITNLEEEYLEKKSWGYSYNIFHSNFVTVFYNLVSGQGKSSWHYHKFKFNRFLVLCGTLKVTMELDSGERVYFLGPDQRQRKLDVVPGVKHQFEALNGCTFIEIESVRCLKTDIVRLEK